MFNGKQDHRNVILRKNENKLNPREIYQNWASLGIEELTISDAREREKNGPRLVAYVRMKSGEKFLVSEYEFKVLLEKNLD